MLLGNLGSELATLRTLCVTAIACIVKGSPAILKVRPIHIRTVIEKKLHLIEVAMEACIVQRRDPFLVVCIDVRPLRRRKVATAVWPPMIAMCSAVEDVWFVAFTFALFSTRYSQQFRWPCIDASWSGVLWFGNQSGLFT